MPAGLIKNNSPIYCTVIRQCVVTCKVNEKKDMLWQYTIHDVLKTTISKYMKWQTPVKNLRQTSKFLPDAHIQQK